MTNDPNWTVRASRTVLADRWINLRADDCVTADGHEIAPYYVLSYPEWTHVVALTERDEVILVRQYRHAVGTMVLELPGGVVDTGETPAQAAHRELIEETGYSAERMQAVCALFTNPATHTNRLHAFAAHGVRQVGTQALEAGEHGLSVHLFPLAELIPRLPEGVLGQAMQVSALLLGLAALGRISFAAAHGPDCAGAPI